MRIGERFVYILQGESDPERHDVGITEDVDRIHSEDVDVAITAILTLDPTGQCRFVIGEALYAEWEVRRLALELLFFDEPDTTD